MTEQATERDSCYGTTSVDWVCVGGLKRKADDGK